MTEANGGQRVGLPEDDASIIEPSGTLVCGACRTRESDTWWKAPKHISANALCETCGMNWRKYADLNVRPSREESLPVTKTKAATEKREGTPLQGPSAKRSKVCFDTHDGLVNNLMSSQDFGVSTFHPSSHSVQRAATKMHVLSTEWSSG